MDKYFYSDIKQMRTLRENKRAQLDMRLDLKPRFVFFVIHNGSHLRCYLNRSPHKVMSTYIDIIIDKLRCERLMTSLTAVDLAVKKSV